MRLTLALGANLGDRQATLATARTLIYERIGPAIAVSQLRETAAWGRVDQPDFLNQVIVVSLVVDSAKFGSSSSSVPVLLHRLLDEVQAIEATLGRQRDQPWGPRTCDIDLIFLDDLRYEDARISLPHPWWSEREFVGGIIREELPCLLLGWGNKDVFLL